MMQNQIHHELFMLRLAVDVLLSISFCLVHTMPRRKLLSLLCKAAVWDLVNVILWRSTSVVSYEIMIQAFVSMD